MPSFTLPGFNLAHFVRATLDEDLGLGLPGGGHDVTSESVIPADARFSGVMDSRDPIVVAGLPIAAAFFRALDPALLVEREARVMLVEEVRRRSEVGRRVRSLDVQDARPPHALAIPPAYPPAPSYGGSRR